MIEICTQKGMTIRGMTDFSLATMQAKRGYSNKYPGTQGK